MFHFFMKIINRWRRIYYLKRHGKHLLEQHRGVTATHYNANPRFTAVLQLFNKRENVEAIILALLKSAAEEIIVIDDGSSDGALEILPSLLTGKNHFIIRSNDLFEVRTYSRALDFARGEIVALLQDDDIPPLDGVWVKESLDLFDRYPKLAILGGRDGLELELRDERLESKEFQNPIKYRLVNHHKGRRTDFPFTFVDAVNRAPMLVRRKVIQELGGIDNVFAPFQCDDIDLCLRCWRAGLLVGLYSTGFIRDVGVGGMRLFNADKVAPQAKKNWGIICNRYGDDIARGHISALVAEARRSYQVG